MKKIFRIISVWLQIFPCYCLSNHLFIFCIKGTKIQFAIYFFLTVVQFGYAQTEAEAVCLRKVTNVDIQIEGGNLKISEHYILEKAFYKNFEKYAHESVYYSDLDPI